MVILVLNAVTSEKDQAQHDYGGDKTLNFQGKWYRSIHPLSDAR